MVWLHFSLLSRVAALQSSFPSFPCMRRPASLFVTLPSHTADQRILSLACGPTLHFACFFIVQRQHLCPASSRNHVWPFHFRLGLSPYCSPRKTACPLHLYQLNLPHLEPCIFIDSSCSSCTWQDLHTKPTPPKITVPAFSSPPQARSRPFLLAHPVHQLCAH